MSKDIPEIDDLTRGINDSELILTQDTAGNILMLSRKAFEIFAGSMDSRKACMEAMRLCMETILHKARSCVRP